MSFEFQADDICVTCVVFATFVLYKLLGFNNVFDGRAHWTFPL